MGNNTNVREEIRELRRAAAEVAEQRAAEANSAACREPAALLTSDILAEIAELRLAVRAVEATAGSRTARYEAAQCESTKRAAASSQVAEQRAADGNSAACREVVARTTCSTCGIHGLTTAK